MLIDAENQEQFRRQWMKLKEYVNLFQTIKLGIRNTIKFQTFEKRVKFNVMKGSSVNSEIRTIYVNQLLMSFNFY